ncbi:MAG TPA: hypothetical protein VJ989_00695 [Solirubrobacterales bacterium]|nr:hypothetical protein [Solirubrobacterales bacterium]
MDLIERLSVSRRAGFKVGTLMAAIIAFAVFVLGAPPWILVPVSMVGGTAFATVHSRALRNLERRRDNPNA